MIQDIVSRSTVAITVTPLLNGQAVTDLGGGRLQFKLASVDGTHMAMKESMDFDIHFSPAEMDLPPGPYRWSCRWIVGEDVHFLGRGKVDILRNDFTKEEDY